MIIKKRQNSVISNWIANNHFRSHMHRFWLALNVIWMKILIGAVTADADAASAVVVSRCHRHCVLKSCLPKNKKSCSIQLYSMGFVEWVTPLELYMNQGKIRLNWVSLIPIEVCACVRVFVYVCILYIYISMCVVFPSTSRMGFVLALSERKRDSMIYFFRVYGHFNWPRYKNQKKKLPTTV